MALFSLEAADKTLLNEVKSLGKLVSIFKDKFYKETPYLLWGVLFLSLIPILSALLGIDWANSVTNLNTNHSDIKEHLFHFHSGAFTHAILEWSALMIAVGTYLFSFAKYYLRKDYVVPVLCLALLFAGVMDAFHTLAAVRLIEAKASNNDLIPFTWALCRLFNSLLCIVGGGFVLLIKNKDDLVKAEKSHVNILMVTGLIFVGLAYLTITLTANSKSLPQAQFPNSFITRPWDIYPLATFLIAGGIFYFIHKRERNYFTFSLVLYTIPAIAVQLHMAFGSSALFDAHFNMAHTLKAFSYFIPFMGLVLDYIYSSKKVVTSENRYRSLVSSVPDVVFMAIKTPSGKFQINYLH